MKMLAYLSVFLLAGAAVGAQEVPHSSPSLLRTLAWAGAERAALPGIRTGPFAEPADSIYRLAQAALNENDYRRAAQLFQTVVDRYPDSDFAMEALYWKAYALFRGMTSSRDLQLAVDALDRQELRYPKARTLNDAKQLRAQISAEQARRGDAAAFGRMQADANKLNTEKGCPTADDEARLIALRGLQQNAPDEVMPVLQKLLTRTDECSVRLRKNVVYMVAQTKEEERSDILLKVASSDPSNEVRREAVQWLAEVNTERAAKALDSILFSASDPDMRERALSALSRHPNPAARLSLRRFAELTNVPTDLRVRAVMNIATSPRKTGDEMDFLFGLFNKTASPELREAIIEGVYQIGRQSNTRRVVTVPGGQQTYTVSAEAQKLNERALNWMLGIARDKHHETEVRKKALYYASMGGIELKDQLNLYDELSGQQDMQEQMLYVYRQRKEPEATDKLMQIAKNEKNPELRKKAISYLGEKKDPRVRQFLLDIVNP